MVYGIMATKCFHEIIILKTDATSIFVVVFVIVRICTARFESIGVFQQLFQALIIKPMLWRDMFLVLLNNTQEFFIELHFYLKTRYNLILEQTKKMLESLESFLSWNTYPIQDTLAMNMIKMRLGDEDL
jgi:hypothetical protein